MPTTLLLDKETWDLSLDDKGYLAVATDEYAIAQNVANAVRLFTKDAYFEQQDGIPHFSIELGHIPSESVVRARINETAKSVAGVVDAVTQLTNFNNRNLEGQIIITTGNGVTLNVDL